MYLTLIFTTIKERLSSIVRLVICLSILTIETTSYFLMRKDYGDTGDALVFSLVIGAGIIGQDISSGVLQLLFVRPIKRTNYVLCKWLAISLLSFVVCVVQMAIFTGKLAIFHDPISGKQVIDGLIGRAALCFATSATLVLFSSLSAGMADIVIFSLSFVIIGGAGLLTKMYDIKILIQIFAHLMFFLSPNIAFHSGLASIFACLSNISLCLFLASLVMNRREISYAD